MVASNTRDPQIKSCHRLNFICLSTVINLEKTKINGKEAGNGPFKKMAKRRLDDVMELRRFLVFVSFMHHLAKFENP